MGAAHTVAVVTVVTCSHMHRARVLLASVARYLPEARCYAVLADRDQDGRLGAQPFEVIPLESLPVPDMPGFVRRYGPAELSFATKPWGLAELFRRGFDRVIYFDSDVVVYSSLQPMLEVLDDAAIVLTPHLTSEGVGDVGEFERTILLAGAYNAGFIGLSRDPSAERFLGWWQDKLLHHCRIDIERGMVGDQRWLDLVPGLFDGVRILRHPGWNFAWWNMLRRPVTMVEGALRAGGEPLVFVHYSGLVSAASFAGRRANEDAAECVAPEIRALIDNYVMLLEREGARHYATLPFALASAGARARAASRNRLQAMARHALHAVTTSAFRRRVLHWLRAHELRRAAPPVK